MKTVKLEETKDRRRLHIGSYFVDLNESEYHQLVNIFANRPKRQKKTTKEHETEIYVGKYILENGYPPTYEDIKNHFNLKSRTAAYARCKKFRFKLVTRAAGGI
jgi:hypothetical protein